MYSLSRPYSVSFSLSYAEKWLAEAYTVLAEACVVGANVTCGLCCDLVSEKECRLSLLSLRQACARCPGVWHLLQVLFSNKAGHLWARCSVEWHLMHLNGLDELCESLFGEVLEDA